MHELKLITIYRRRALRELKESVVIYHREGAGEGGRGDQRVLGEFYRFHGGTKRNKLSLKNIKGRLLKIDCQRGRITKKLQKLIGDQVKFIVTQPKSSDPPHLHSPPGHKKLGIGDVLLNDCQSSVSSSWLLHKYVSKYFKKHQFRRNLNAFYDFLTPQV